MQERYALRDLSPLARLITYPAWLSRQGRRATALFWFPRRDSGKVLGILDAPCEGCRTKSVCVLPCTTATLHKYTW